MTVTQLNESTRHTRQSPHALKTIVVATDFSENARSAMDWATELAKAHRAKIVLVHAADIEVPAITGAGSSIDKHVQHRLKLIRNGLTASGVSARIDCEFGRPWEVIAQLAKKVDADLVVVGAHGTSKFPERIFGTVADRLVKTTSIPVLVHGTTRSRNQHGVQTVLAATDFSEEAALALSTAVRLVSSVNHKIHVVLFHTVALPLQYIDVDVPMSVPEYWDESEQTAGRQLETLAGSLRSEHLDVSVTTFRGYPSEAILQQADAVNADLITIGTFGRRGLNRFLMGSVAERVLHHAKCPVLIVRQPDSDAPIQLSPE